METIRFDELNLDPRILRAVTDMGFEAASPIQAQAIPVEMEGHDMIGQAQTGTGKTAAFWNSASHEDGPGKQKDTGNDPLPDERTCDPGSGRASPPCENTCPGSRFSRSTADRRS